MHAGCASRRPLLLLLRRLLLIMLVTKLLLPLLPSMRLLRQRLLGWLSILLPLLTSSLLLLRPAPLLLLHWRGWGCGWPVG